jgi:Fe-S cluster biogenesis protein NfuA
MSIPFTDEELLPAVERCILKIEPMLALDGGSIKLVAIKDHIIYVQLQGACVGCPSSANTLKYGVEKKIKEDIHQELSVVNVPIGAEIRLDEFIEGLQNRR